MRSGTSFFDKTLFCKTLARFWPIWVGNLVFWVLTLPLSALLRLRQDLLHGTDRLERFAMNVGDNAGELAVVLAVGLGVLAAMAVLSHLYSARSANFMGALPVRREGQFLSVYLAGLAMLIVPNLAAFLLTLLVEAVGYALWIFPLGCWLATVCAAEFFFYSAAVFVGQFAGHILALPVYYGVFNAFAFALYALLESIMREFYYGFTRFSGVWEEIAILLTPVIPFAQMDCDVIYENGVLVQRMDGWQALVIYPLAALALTAFALLLYRRRHMESAGDVVAVAALRPVFKYGVAACSGLTFGLLVTVLLDLEEPGMMVSILLCGVAGYFVAQMLLDKTFRVLKAWKGAVAVAVCFAALFAVIAFDLTGFETRLPAADAVESVEIQGLAAGKYDSGNWVNETVTDPAVIQKIILLHAAAVDRRDAQDVRYEEEDRWWDFEVVYHLKNGGTFSRGYDLVDSVSNVNVPGTVSYGVEQLMADRNFMYTVYGFAEAEALEREGARLEKATFNTIDGYEEIHVGGYTGEEAALILAAVKADFAAGNIGRRSAFGEEDEDMKGILCFSWIVPVNHIRTKPADPDSYGYDYAVPEIDYRVDVEHFSLEIVVDEDSAQTQAVLRALQGK